MGFIPPVHFRYGSKDSNWTRQLETNQVSAEGEAEGQSNCARAARILSKIPVLLFKRLSQPSAFSGGRRLCRSDEEIQRMHFRLQGLTNFKKEN